ncbi:MAG: VOC family protein [Pikeienuella sp.]
MIQSLDHFVLTVADPDRTVAFYGRHFGMKEVVFGEGRRALAFGAQKINLHRAGAEYHPHAKAPVPGSADLCFLVDEPVTALALKLAEDGVEVIEGPVAKTGATGPLLSIYVRDPDGNLVELSNPA